MTEEKVVDTDPDPSPNPGATRLRIYWTRGAGAAKIGWGAPGDFNRCVRHLRKYVSDPKGLCNVFHQAALGAPPGHGHGKSFDDLDIKMQETLLYASTLIQWSRSELIALDLMEDEKG